jgi:hypothetical protein
MKRIVVQVLDGAGQLVRNGRRASRAQRGRAGLIAVLTLACAWPSPADAYLTFGTLSSGGPVVVKWAATPVRYFVNDTRSADVSPSDFQQAVGRAFSTWQAVQSSSITYQFVGFTAASPFVEDGQTTLGFASMPQLDRVLASTDILVDVTTGAIVEADILFNSAFTWSVAPGGQDGSFDLESIALHEIGHLSGLGHSAIGETELGADGGRRVIATGSVMFPIAYPPGNVLGRTLRADDIAGISDLYPDNGFGRTTGSISGHVIRDGSAVFGVHVLAYDMTSQALVANFSLDDRGTFSIHGLSPGPHVLRVEPLDDADVESFLNAGAPVDLDFRVTFLNRIVVVPEGGDAGTIDIVVTPK